MTVNFEGIWEELKAGAKKWVLICFALTIILYYPIYLLSIQATKFWFYNVPFNPQKYVTKKFVNSKSDLKADVQTVSSSYVDLADGRRLVYTFLDNRNNKNLGFDPFVFKKQLLDNKGSSVQDSFDQVYLLPGQTRYIFDYTENTDAVTLSIQRQPETNQVEYNPNANDFLKQPEFDIRESIVEESQDPNEKNLLKIKASIKNPTKFAFKKVDFVMLIRDTNDAVIGVQNYSFNEFLPNEERDIRLTYPKSVNKDASSLDVRYSVNFLDESNIRLQ
jgi:hypothetical protein